MRRKVWAFSAMVLILLAGLSVSAAQNGKSSTQQGSTPNGRPFVALQDQLDGIYQQLDALRSASASRDDLISTLAAAVLLLETRMASAEASIEDLQAHDAWMDEWVAALESQWHDAEARLAEQKDSLQQLIEADQALQELVAALKLKADALETSLATLAGEVSTESSAMWNELAGIEAQLDALKLELSGKQSAIVEACAPGSSIRQVDATGTVACEADDVGAGAAAKLNVTEYTEPSFKLVKAYSVGTSTVFCPSGYVLLSGGYVKGSAGSVMVDGPTENGWQVSIQTTSAASVVRAIARCVAP